MSDPQPPPREEYRSTEQCRLCPVEYQLWDHVTRAQPCHHHFHSECMARWALSLGTDDLGVKAALPCPVCRSPVETQLECAIIRIDPIAAAANHTQQ